MDDPQNIPGPGPNQDTMDSAAGPEQRTPLDPMPAAVHSGGTVEQATPPAVAHKAVALRKQGFRRNLYMLLTLALAAFVLTSWILVRLDAPFAAYSSGPQEVVRAQLRALERGQLRPAYDLFSARYRQQVSFDAWRELVVTHSRMFHADVVRAGTPAQAGPRVNLEIFLHGADEKDYRARFTLIRSDGRWWIDDVHWTETSAERDFART
jgi:Domain of unknown function (DUF4864)